MGAAKSPVTTPLGLETQGLLRIAPDGSVQAETFFSSFEDIERRIMISV
jgi:hypothetical protein